MSGLTGVDGDITQVQYSILFVTLVSYTAGDQMYTVATHLDINHCGVVDSDLGRAKWTEKERN